MIPARYAASRFPGKLMQDLGGITVIQRTYEATVSTELFDAVYVVTDSDIIYNEITSNGGKAIMSIKEHSCGSDRIAEAVSDMDVDIVVNVQGDEPFTERESLEKVLGVFYEDDADRIDLASLMTPMNDWDDIVNPNSVKVIVDRDNYALYFSRSPIPYPRDKEINHTYYKHKGVYAFRKQAILDFYRLPMQTLEASEKIECIRYLEYGKNIKMVETRHEGVEIDTPEDLEKAKKLINNQSLLSAESTVAEQVKLSVHKNFPMVPRVVFGKGSFNQIKDILAPARKHGAPFIYLIDNVFENNTSFIADRISLSSIDKIIYVSTAEEPKTSQVDALVTQIKHEYQFVPSGIVGIGGGSMLDLAKAVAIMLNNPGSASEYQGWDLVKNKAIYHVGVPTISGTGAEVSRTTVLTGPDRKLGINSDFTPFDQVILDPELIRDVPKEQWFYTGMDCYIHCIESLNGTYLNTFSQSYGEKALDLCKAIFLDNNLDKEDADAKLMMASWHGGMSIAYSQVGVAHAMSYGLAYVLGTKHGIGNCIVFDKLEEFYPEGVDLFKEMQKTHNINLPSEICANVTEEQLDVMTAVALSLEPLWENALGPDWKSKIDSDKIKAIYRTL
ncbi:3-deoxy-manno-octulosonate cytidylyltransferase [Aquimarina sp. MMG016]|uniref:3-deoxy-manno-octulosonate cytidylyltransferase n=1 Tax=Aquimarina sp. MMG016 TaxID=2822690 RepID=UPI001B3A4150|nr:3-deoxy-manno-octulosonate cytidylyltransferase [Aquimarina sp. MMG016]MBQ4822490.1 3-deoxy-manno-octulosonate cytidylyltransferase [Aquimarina sp. MMG016]